MPYLRGNQDGCLVESAISLAAILPVSNLFHPVDYLSVRPLLDGDVGHSRRRRGTMPVLLVWWEPDHISGTNLLD